MEIRNFGRVRSRVDLPSLVQPQTRAYADFLQADIPAEKRENKGLEEILRETFPITNHDGTLTLSYVKYELGKPRFTEEECRKLGLTYGRPLKITLRLEKEEPVEEEIYFGEMPIMIGGGEFIVHGAERAIVAQLHRSPGVDFVEDSKTTGRRLHSCRIIPERGSWIEIEETKRETLLVRIDQSGKFPVTCFLRALSPKFSSNADIIKLFYPVETVKIKKVKDWHKLVGRYLAGEIVDESTGEIVAQAGAPLTVEIVERIASASLKEIDVIKGDFERELDPLIVNTLQEDTTRSHEEALLRIYARLRPGTPPSIDRASQLIRDRFFDPNRYRLGRVGRFRLNRKLKQDVPEDQMILSCDDVINAIRYLLNFKKEAGEADDIDHLGNRRVRMIDELAGEEIRKGFLKLKRAASEKMSLKNADELTPKNIVNPKAVSATIDAFFARGELSQVVDQTNPLSQLTHERRLSALGPGGLNRKRAGFEVRDVHISHYGRICPIETPEGTNIGLITSLSVYADIDELGFLISPYLRVEKGKVADEIVWLRADEEEGKTFAPATVTIDENGYIAEEEVLARQGGGFNLVKNTEVDYIDVSTKQIVSVSASLIPFLEHDDANRALMGSNMQRQAVPLLRTEAPIVATGMEKEVPNNSNMVVKARKAGTVTKVTADTIEIEDEVYRLKKFYRLNERTCLNQRPIVKQGDKVEAGQIIADGAATSNGELALGKNVLVAFMPWDGYNFEDAIVVSEGLLKDDRYTSIHIEEFDIEARETKTGREEFTRDIPNVSEKALANLDERGIVRVGTYVRPGDILVGKIVPKTRSELTPEEKLLYVIFGRAGEDVKNESLEVPTGVEGIVIGAEHFTRKPSLSDEEKKEADRRAKEVREEYNAQIVSKFVAMIKTIEERIGRRLVDTLTGEELNVDEADDKLLLEIEDNFQIGRYEFKDQGELQEIRRVAHPFLHELDELHAQRDREIDRMRHGDELSPGVLEKVKVYVAMKRKLSIGDKMAGRHGNKGVIAKIVPEEDMPYLPDGTPVEIVLNPLGVPSRMNIGQIFETHLGWAARVMGYQAICPVFDGASEEEIRNALEEAGLPPHGKTVLYDGRTGEPFDQEVTVGYIYMMKLSHLVDDKIHARATGPYSLITQQPLGGKARAGGQRLGEMEVWALEAYGAAHVLQEMLTVKSDDVDGRTKIYESIVKGKNILEAGMPTSFEVLMNEIRGLALNIELKKPVLGSED